MAVRALNQSGTCGGRAPLFRAHCTISGIYYTPHNITTDVYKVISQSSDNAGSKQLLSLQSLLYQFIYKIFDSHVE
jgi:hypothetical protein